LPEPVRLSVDRPAIERQRLSRDPPLKLTDAPSNTPDAVFEIEIAHALRLVFPSAMCTASVCSAFSRPPTI
jgi:hypothetical protein